MTGIPKQIQKDYICSIPEKDAEFILFYLFYIQVIHTVKCRCNERQYNEMFRTAKLFLGPFPFPYLMCVKTFHFNEFRTFSITN